MEPHAYFLYSILFLVVFLVIKFNKPGGASKYNLPPSPLKLPIIGNLHQLHGGSPHHVLSSLAKKYGPIMMLHFGPVPTLVISSADLARDVLKTHELVFLERPKESIVEHLLWGKDLAHADYGEYWRQVRKLCTLKLLSIQKVESFRTVREEEVGLMIKKIEESPWMVNLSKMLMSLTNGISSRIILGKKYDDKSKEIVKEFAHLLGLFNVKDFIPSLSWVNRFNGLDKRVENNFAAMNSFLEGVIEDHIVNGGGESEDFVDVMLAIEKDYSDLGMPIARENSKAVIWDMYTAGADSTAITIDWAMAELLRHPEIMKQVQKEVRDVAKGSLLVKENDIEEMHHLKAVIKETFRLHPPLPILALRKSTEHAKLQGYDIPANTSVMINAFVISRDPAWWDEPERFWPKRFLKGNTAPVDFKGQNFELIPFGAGRRGCPGIPFTTAMVDVALANLLNRFDWTLPNGMSAEDLDMNEADALSVCRITDLVVNARPYF